MQSQKACPPEIRKWADPAYGDRLDMARFQRYLDALTDETKDPGPLGSPEYGRPGRDAYLALRRGE